MKDSLVGDHFSPAYTPRLRILGITGQRVKDVAIGALDGLSSADVDLSIRDTQVIDIFKKKFEFFW